MGKRGSGKSYCMAKLLKTCARVVCFDTVGQYQPVQLPGFVFMEQPGQLKEFLRKHRARDFRIWYRPEHQVEKHLTAVAGLVTAVGNCVLGVDEVDYFGTAGSSNIKLDWLARYGRHRRVALVWTARRPAEVFKNLTAACWALRIFRMTEPRDMEYLAHYIGEAADKLPGLGQFCHLRWQDDGKVFINGPETP